MADPKVAKWEYTMTVQPGLINVAELNDYGDQGWELVSLTISGPHEPAISWLCVFKRPAQSADARKDDGPTAAR